MNTATKKNIFKTIFKKRRPRQFNIDRLEWNTDAKIPLPIFGLAFTAFMMMLAWVMIGTPQQAADGIAHFLSNYRGVMPFDDLLRAFGAALILGINFTLTVFFVAVDQPVTMDVLDTLEEMDDRLMTRLDEMMDGIREDIERMNNEKNDESEQ